jgi:2-polyprenyl-6-methoxyphenol hydroxylase-like FAD-dependent oxidoreductase
MHYIGHRGAPGRAIIIGGSTSGMLSAALLARDGWKVDIYERSPVELVGRGAGIVCHDELEEALNKSGAGTECLGIDVSERVAFDDEGNIVGRRPFPQTVTSWDRVHQLVRSTVPDESYHLDRHLVSVEQHADRVTAAFQSGETVTGDILIGADGFRSPTRLTYLPGCQPQYAGYVIWRGLADEMALAPAVRDIVFERFTFQFPPNNEILGYPIAGQTNDLRQGHRRYNWVWYRLAGETELRMMLTDATGQHHPLGIPPTLIQNDVIEAMRRDADTILAPPMREVLRNVPRPFFTPIFDLASSSYTFGRVALVGDAAVVARPHVGYGTSKAAGDALSLARHLASGVPVEAALTAYDQERRPFGWKCFMRGRQLGVWLTGHAPANEREREESHELHTVEGILRHIASDEFLGANMPDRASLPKAAASSA